MNEDDRAAPSPSGKSRFARGQLSPASRSPSNTASPGTNGASAAIAAWSDALSTESRRLLDPTAPAAARRSAIASTTDTPGVNSFTVRWRGGSGLPATATSQSSTSVGGGTPELRWPKAPGTAASKGSAASMASAGWGTAAEPAAAAAAACGGRAAQADSAAAAADEEDDDDEDRVCSPAGPAAMAGSPRPTHPGRADGRSSAGSAGEGRMPGGVGGTPLEPRVTGVRAGDMRRSASLTSLAVLMARMPRRPERRSGLADPWEGPAEPGVPRAALIGDGGGRPAKGFGCANGSVFGSCTEESAAAVNIPESAAAAVVDDDEDNDDDDETTLAAAGGAGVPAVGASLCPRDGAAGGNIGDGSDGTAADDEDEQDPLTPSGESRASAPRSWRLADWRDPAAPAAPLPGESDSSELRKSIPPNRGASSGGSIAPKRESSASTSMPEPPPMSGGRMVGRCPPDELGPSAAGRAGCWNHSSPTSASGVSRAAASQPTAFVPWPSRGEAPLLPGPESACPSLASASVPARLCCKAVSDAVCP